MIPPQPPNQGPNASGDLKLQNLSREQIKRLQKSMKKPEFMGLLNEYMIQISDPKNKTQYDQYLKQMEKQGQLPKHMKLIKLKPEFCFRTHIISNKNKKHQMKFFVNMCSSDYIQKPSCEPVAGQNGGMGYNWKVPNSLGKIRYDQDRHKNPCQVIDCGFHPDTFLFANQNTAFQAMIISVALQGAERQLGQRKQTLSKDYIILKNVKCKGENGEPALLPIRYIDGKAYNRGEGPAQQQRNQQGKETKLQKQISKQKQQYQGTKKAQQQQKPEQKQQMEEDLGDHTEKKQLVQDLQKGIHAPKFTSIYTYVTDYSDFIDGPTARKTRTLPSTFTVQFKVPRMENISQANTLQINEKKIVLAVQGKYYIDISFQDMKVKSYPLKHSQAKAKFDKKKKTLRVQIPVDIASIPEQQLPQFKQSLAQIGEQQAQNGQVVENQTWKNKVLQISEQSSNTQKFLPKEQAEQSQKPIKKLIQQIDQDDVVQESKTKNYDSLQEDGEQIQQKKDNQEDNEDLKLTNFSVRSYYPQPNHTLQFSAQTVVQDQSCIQKQQKTNLIIMFYMRNYDPNDIKIILSQKYQLILLWKDRINNKIYGTMLQCEQSGQSEDKAKDINVNKCQILRRVGYCAVVVHKGKNGGEIQVKDVGKGKGYTLKDYQAKIEKIQGQNQARRLKLKEEDQKAAALAAKSKQIKQTIIENQDNNKSQPNNNQNKNIEQQSKSSLNEIDSNIQNKSLSQLQSTDPKNQKVQQQSSQLSTSTIQTPNIFQKLPIQFIKFNVSFIDVLD